MIWFVRNQSWQHSDRGNRLRVCIIGTSHLACLKLGWDKIKDQFPDDEVVFFGAPGGLLRHLRANNGKLISIDRKLTRSLAFTSGGASEIDPTAYDAIVLFGLHLKLPRFRLGVTKAVRLETIKNFAERGLNSNNIDETAKVGRQEVLDRCQPA